MEPRAKPRWGTITAHADQNEARVLLHDDSEIKSDTAENNDVDNQLSRESVRNYGHLAEKDNTNEVSGLDDRTAGNDKTDMLDIGDEVASEPVGGDTTEGFKSEFKAVNKLSE